MTTSFVRPSMEDFVPSCRDLIMWELLERIAAMTNPIEPDPDAGNTLFSEVVFGETVDVPEEARPCVGIIETKEERTELLFPYIDKSLQVSIEFRWNQKNGVDNFSTYRYYLAQLQKRLFGSEENYKLITNEHPDGMTFNVLEDENYPQIEGTDEENPSGILNITIMYRHVNGDPYKFTTE